MNDFVEINKLWDLKLVNSEHTHRRVGELNVHIIGLFSLHVKRHSSEKKSVSVWLCFTAANCLFSSHRPDHLVVVIKTRHMLKKLFMCTDQEGHSSVRSTDFNAMRQFQLVLLKRSGVNRPFRVPC